MREHIAFRYLRLGYSVIPLQPLSKKPYTGVLSGGEWGPYQQRLATNEEVQVWLTHNGPEPNWGLVCGQISGGLYCGDCDNGDPLFPPWVLEHARDPIFQGACIVRSGSGLAHIWFKSPNALRSQRWKPSQGRAVGDIRGDGAAGRGPSYMVVPPSLHPDTQEAYRVLVGSFDKLPVIDNGEAFLADILKAYRREVPDRDAPPTPSSSMHILQLTADERLVVQAHVLDLRLKGKIRDTLLVPGNQDPGSRHWMHMADGSHSGIDYAVVCELIRKNQTLEQVERIYAGTEVGRACYANKSRSHHGHSYLETTYVGALAKVEEERRNSRIATGADFTVLEAIKRRVGKDAKYILRLQSSVAGREPVVGSVEVVATVLFTEDAFKRAVFEQTGFVLTFQPNQMGKHNYPSFVRAVDLMVTEEVVAPPGASREGYLAVEIENWIRTLPVHTSPPPTLGDAPGLGWRIGSTHYLRLQEVGRRLQSLRTPFKHSEDLYTVLDHLGPWDFEYHTWPGISTQETLIKLDRSGPQTRPSLPALPAPSAPLP